MCEKSFIRIRAISIMPAVSRKEASGGRSKAKTIVPKGQGDRGDQKRVPATA
jgi:hypothetical protein